MTDLSPIAPRLAPLVRMLGSDNDGEALQAARAIGRALTSHKADFHDLAERVLQETWSERDWEEPAPKRGNDVVVPKRWKPPPRPGGPPLWEKLCRNARLLWLDRIVTAEGLPIEQRHIAGARRAQEYSQPHRLLKPAELAAVNHVFVAAWLADLRPIADLMPGDPRMPIRWTGKNRGDVVVVLRKGLPAFDGRAQQFVGACIHRLEYNRDALSHISVDEMERIEDLLLQAYEVGARP